MNGLSVQQNAAADIGQASKGESSGGPGASSADGGHAVGKQPRRAATKKPIVLSDSDSEGDLTEDDTGYARFLNI